MNITTIRKFDFQKSLRIPYFRFSDSKYAIRDSSSAGTASLLITADDGGSNSSKGKLWKFELQELANETGLEITALHFPRERANGTK